MLTASKILQHNTKYQHSFCHNTKQKNKNKQKNNHHIQGYRQRDNKALKSTITKMYHMPLLFSPDHRTGRVENEIVERGGQYCRSDTE